MLDEELLVGPGRQARDTLRPLAYSTLADLVHHVKDQIDLNQVSRVIQARFVTPFVLVPPPPSPPPDENESLRKFVANSKQ